MNTLQLIDDYFLIILFIAKVKNTFKYLENFAKPFFCSISALSKF